MTSTPTQNLTILPDLEPSRTLPFSVIDHQLHDRFNFGLDETVADIISAVLTGLTLLLIADILTSLAVRAKGTHLNSRSIHRFYVITRMSNPLELVAQIRNCLAFSKGKSGERENGNQSNGTETNISAQSHQTGSTVFEPQCRNENGKINSSPSRPSIHILTILLISAMGLAIILLDVLFVFLGTSTTSTFNVDFLRLQTFMLRDDGSDQTIGHSFFPRNLCTTGPITSKPRFVSQAIHTICFEEGRRWNDIEEGNRTDVRVGMTPYSLLINVTVDGMTRVVMLSQNIILPNTSSFYVSDSVTPSNVRAQILRALKRRGIPTQTAPGTVETEPDNDDVDLRNEPGWAVLFSVNLSNFVPPARFQKAASVIVEEEDRTGNIEQQTRSIALNLYLANVSLSTVHMEGFGRGVEDISERRFLENGGVVLVLFQRGRISLGALMILDAVLIISWLLITVMLGWQSGVDHRIAWSWAFNQSTEYEQLESGDDRVMSLDDPSLVSVKSRRIDESLNEKRLKNVAQSIETGT